MLAPMPFRSLSGLKDGDDLVSIALPEDVDYFEKVRDGDRRFEFQSFVHSQEVGDMSSDGVSKAMRL